MLKRWALLEPPFVVATIRSIPPLEGRAIGALKRRPVATLRRRGWAIAIEATLVTRSARLLLLRSFLVRIEIALRVEAALSPFLTRWLPGTARWRATRAFATRSGRVLAGARRHRSLGLLRAALLALGALAFGNNFAITLASGILFGQIHVHRFEERLLFTGREIAPEPERNARHHQRPDPHARQAIDDDAGGVHHPANDVIHPLVQRNREHDAIA